MFRLSHLQLYWICQLTGWSGICVQQLLDFYSHGYLEGLLILFPLLILPIGIGVTHVYRAIFHWLRLGEKSVNTLLWSGIVAVFALSFMMFLTHHNLGHTLTHTEVSFELLHTLVNLTTWAPIMFGWVGVYHLNKILTRLHGTGMKQLELSNELKESQLYNLKAQINPHFLFNALNSIRALIYIDPDRAGNALSRLSGLLRSALHAPATGLIPLQEELAFVRDYLSLEQLRFEERLQLEWDLDPALDQVKIPPLLLLTLAENAVKHGIAQIVEGGHIRISSRAQAGKVILEIANTGQIIPAEKEGIGLDNARRRLVHLLGSAAHLSLTQQETAVVARIELPLILNN
jgi:hypothetical protein